MDGDKLLDKDGDIDLDKLGLIEGEILGE